MDGSCTHTCSCSPVHSERSRPRMRGASIAFCICLLAGLPGFVSTENSTVRFITVHRLELTPSVPLPIPFKYDENVKVTFNYSFVAHNVTVYPKKGWILQVSSDNGKIANIEGQQSFYIDFTKPTGNFSIDVHGNNAGRSKLQFRVYDWTDNPLAASGMGSSNALFGEQMYPEMSFQMYVTMETRPVDTMFNIVVFLLVITANIGMGTQVDLDIVKSQIVRPVAPAIGLFSQFVFMPLIAYAVAVNLDVEPGIALGLFACGCAPGGLASNIFTYLLHGNVSLSITMTLVSTLASLGLLPLWLFTLGPRLYKDSDIKIPFLNIFMSLFVIVIPTVIGLVMKVKTPRAAAILIKATKIILAVFMVFMFTVGVYASWWVLDLADSKVLIASAALPYLGFILGGFAAFVGRRSPQDIITIAVETGIQNTAVPIVLLRMSLRGPEQATGIVVPLLSSTLTPIPLLFAVIYLEVKSCLRRRKSKYSAKDEELPEGETSVDEDRNSGIRSKLASLANSGETEV